MDSRRLSSVDEGDKIRHKHQVLLQEYLVLQKECVSKKRKLKEAKERRATLLDEIRFLKRRRSFLLKMRSQNSERQQDVVESQKTDARSDVGTSGRYLDATKPPLQNSRPAMGSIRNSGGIDKKGGITPSKVGKKPKDLFVNGKRAEKKKISWQDPLALKV